jgi:NifU-like protein involved in Fe-S cluster formation
MSDPAYPPAVLDLFHRVPGAGRPDGPGWASGEAREPLSATHVRVHLKATNGRIEVLRWEARGCPYTLALAGLLALRAPGQPLGEALPDLRALAFELGAPATKLGRFLVVQDAMAAAVLQLTARPA